MGTSSTRAVRARANISRSSLNPLGSSDVSSDLTASFRKATNPEVTSLTLKLNHHRAKADASLLVILRCSGQPEIRPPLDTPRANHDVGLSKTVQQLWQVIGPVG